jgi:hypothetical protein
MPTGNGQPRTYDLATETANGAVNANLLQAEIVAEVGVISVIQEITVSDVALLIFFQGVLSAPEIVLLDAIVLAHDGAVTEIAAQFYESAASQQTLLETFQVALQKTSNRLAAGEYKLSWYFELKVTPVSTLNSSAEAVFDVDGQTKGTSRCADAGWCSHSGWDRYKATEGAVPVVSILFRRDPAIGGNDSVEIRRLKMSIEPIQLAS